MKNLSYRICRQNQNTHFIFSNLFFLSFENRAIYENVEEYCGDAQTKDDNMAHSHCMLDTEGYKHTLRIRNTYCSSTAAMVARTRLLRPTYIAFLVLTETVCLLRRAK